MQRKTKTITTMTNKIIPIVNDRDYYCSMKFRFQKIDLESKTTYTCHAATPHRVDFSWLADNPGNLHNTPINVAERDMMLKNVRNASCEQNCWSAEDAGATSPRMYQNGAAKTHTSLKLHPEIIDLTIGSDCNLTCTYCCKEFSSTWRRDIINNGDYNLTDSDERFVGTNVDKLLLKISQPQLKESKHYQALLDELVLVAPTVKKLTISGGEPFLDNRLIDTISMMKLPADATVEIFTGLGVGLTRFTKILYQLKNIQNLFINVSVETIGKLYEFNRYGSKWEDAFAKIGLLNILGIKYGFHSVISNLTVFGFVDFYKQFAHAPIELTFAYQPEMMAPYVLDDASKECILKDIVVLPEDFRKQITASIHASPSELQRLNIKEFLLEFTKRRSDLDLTIYPKSFLNWIGINVV